jgi:hypothetical protein
MLRRPASSRTALARRRWRGSLAAVLDQPGRRSGGLAVGFGEGRAQLSEAGPHPIPPPSDELQIPRVAQHLQLLPDLRADVVVGGVEGAVRCESAACLRVFTDLPSKVAYGRSQMSEEQGLALRLVGDTPELVKQAAKTIAIGHIVQGFASGYLVSAKDHGAFGDWLVELANKLSKNWTP